MNDDDIDMLQPGTSSDERLPGVPRYQPLEFAPTNKNNNNEKYHSNYNINVGSNNGSDGGSIAMLSNHVATIGDRSSQSGQPDVLDVLDVDNVVQESALTPHKREYYFMPNKSQVLFYLSDASLLRIRKAGTELQVTDSIDFPLFDVWVEVNCAKSTMILESYGRTVLLVSESTIAECFSKRNSEPPMIAVNDWNGDLFGYLVPGDPFLIEDSGKRTLAKILATENAYGRATVWVCVLESSGREIARFEEYSTIYYTRDVGGFQLKLLALAAFARLTVSECSQTQSCCFSFLSFLFRC